jgi:hypothetical protein
MNEDDASNCSYNTMHFYIPGVLSIIICNSNKPNKGVNSGLFVFIWLKIVAKICDKVSLKSSGFVGKVVGKILLMGMGMLRSVCPRPNRPKITPWMLREKVMEKMLMHRE